MVKDTKALRRRLGCINLKNIPDSDGFLGWYMCKNSHALREKKATRRGAFYPSCFLDWGDGRSLTVVEYASIYTFTYIQPREFGKKRFSSKNRLWKHIATGSNKYAERWL